MKLSKIKYLVFLIIMISSAISFFIYFFISLTKDDNLGFALFSVYVLSGGAILTILSICFCLDKLNE